MSSPYSLNHSPADAQYDLMEFSQTKGCVIGEVYVMNLLKQVGQKSLQILFCATFAVAPSAWADGAESAEWVREMEKDNTFRQAQVDDTYALGVDRFDLDDHTEILGWQLSQSWFFGRQDGEDSGLTLVWQAQASANQVSLSKDGVRLTRRF